MTPRPSRGGPSLGRLKIRIARGLYVVKFALRGYSNGKFESAGAVTAGIVALCIWLIFLVCAFFDSARGGSVWLELLAVGTAALVIGLFILKYVRVPKYLSTARLFRALLSGTLASIAFVMLGLLVTGATESTTLAFVEAASTVTGTNASTIDVSKIEPGVMLLRALGQWVAGAALIVILVRVLPHLGVGGLDADGGVATRSARRLSPKSSGTVFRLLMLYIGLTGLIGVGYISAGMPLVDSAMHSLTTISTGGFSTQVGSIGAYQSGAIEWVGVVGMFIAGISLPLIFLAIRRKDPKRFWRSYEFRFYSLVVLAAASFNAISTGQMLTPEIVRSSLFKVTSAASTTGYIDSVSTLPSAGGQSIVIIVMLIGGMSASMTGGFKVMRLLAISSYIGRELKRTIHPTAVLPIRVGHSSIGQTAFSKIVGEIFLSLLVLIPGALILTNGGLDVEGAFSFALSCLSNFGPAFGDAAQIDHLSELSGLGQTVSAGLMVVGRISITPVLVVLVFIAEPLVRTVRRQSYGRKKMAVR
mgnify:CR=1 FL=1